MSNLLAQQIVKIIRHAYDNEEDFLPLHEPVFNGNEKRYLLETIDSTFVSSVGEFVNRFEREIASITGSGYAIAVVNGTAALHLALLVAGVNFGDEVITQPLTFVATANAISHCGATPIFVDVENDTMGMSPISLKKFLREKTRKKNGISVNNVTGKKIAACVPMHTFGFPLRIEEIRNICFEFNIPLIEDAAESLGSFYKGKHTGTFGIMGTLSFNGNKTLTCGGGGAVITNDIKLAKLAKHISTTAKVAHAWEFVHDMVGYNYRMPNLNAALACAQLEQLDSFIKIKRELADYYDTFFQKQTGVRFVREINEARANYWLNTIVFDTKEQKEDFLEYSNASKVMTRPIWRLMNKLPMYESCQKTTLDVAEYLEDRVVNIPSSVVKSKLYSKV
jgi:aminotransferase in exopolysaccharide biosynthesis